jgi:hypothetical protein
MAAPLDYESVVKKEPSSERTWRNVLWFLNLMSILAALTNVGIAIAAISGDREAVIGLFLCGVLLEPLGIVLLVLACIVRPWAFSTDAEPSEWRWTTLITCSVSLVFLALGFWISFRFHYP